MIRVGGPRGGRVVDGLLLADPVDGILEIVAESSSTTCRNKLVWVTDGTSMCGSVAEDSLSVYESSPVEEEGSRSGSSSSVNVTRRGFSNEAVFGLVNMSSGRQRSSDIHFYLVLVIPLLVDNVIGLDNLWKHSLLRCDADGAIVLLVFLDYEC